MTVRLARLASKLVLSLLLVTILGALAVVTVIPRAVHGAALTVLTGSMTPNIPVGSTVVVRPVDPGTLRVGDVVTYQTAAGKAEYITHRIIAIHTDTAPVTLTTKGDANRGPDLDAVPVTAVRGRVLFHVPYLGTARNAINVRHGGLGLLLLGLIGYAAAQVLSAVRDRRANTPSSTTALSTAEIHDGIVLQLVVATFPVSEFDRLLPCLSAQLLRVDILDETAAQFTVAIARQPEHVDELAEFLQLFAPISLTRSDLMHVPLNESMDPRADLQDRLQRRTVGRHAA